MPDLGRTHSDSLLFVKMVYEVDNEVPVDYELVISVWIWWYGRVNAEVLFCR